MLVSPLPPEQEAEAVELTRRLRVALDAALLQMSRLVVSRQPSELFGATEFSLRERVLALGAKVYEEYLAEKKTAETATASSVRVAVKRRSSRTIGRKS